MIAVIADDFTGAAELAGIGLRYGLRVELLLSAVKDTDADMLVVCTNSRSMDSAEAEAVTGRITEEIVTLQPSLIYKKIDSVFRGHVLDELNMQMQRMNKPRAIVLAANPSLGRTIRDGIYYINGQPVSETGFANDPEFAVTDSSVLKIVKAADDEIQLLKPADILPAEGVVIAEAETAADIKAWAEKAGESSVLAGAGDFFTAILHKKFILQPQAQPVLELPHLYVCGTAFGQSHEFINRVAAQQHCVAWLTDATMQSGETDEIWLKGVTGMLRENNKAIIAIDAEQRNRLNVSALSLRATMARVIKEIIRAADVRELFIEGGSTAAAILEELGIHAFSPVNELARGVVRMKTGDKNIYITVKPGSYQLPQQISALYS